MDKQGLTDFMVEKLFLNEILVRSCRRIMKRKIVLQNLILELFHVVMVVVDDPKSFLRIKDDNRKFIESLKRVFLKNVYMVGWYRSLPVVREQVGEVGFGG